MSVTSTAGAVLRQLFARSGDDDDDNNNPNNDAGQELLDMLKDPFSGDVRLFLLLLIPLPCPAR